MTRNAQEVENRDFLIQTLFTGSNQADIALKVGLSRPSVYASILRFKIRYEVEKGYMERFEEYKNKI